MTPRIQTLADRTIDGHEPSQAGTDTTHPMRVMTRRAAGLAQPPWDAAAAAEVGAFFDDLAPEWHTRTSPERAGVVLDALDRGGVVGGEAAVEIGSGIGAYSGMLADRFDRVVATDLAVEMLRLAPAGPAGRVQSDSAQLPLPNNSVDAVVLVNMFLFPAEVDRVLRPGGAVVWVNSSGEATPIHLSTDDLVDALPGDWTAVTARAGVGLWAVARRAV